MKRSIYIKCKFSERHGSNYEASCSNKQTMAEREGEVIYWRDFVVVKYIDDFLDCTQNAFL